MERFKVIERETKQKPYSKDALGANNNSNAYKFDPLAKEKQELAAWIGSCVSRLGDQTKELEVKLDEMNTSNKRKRVDKDKIESTKHRLELDRKYVETLERLAKILKKNLISVKKVQEIKDDVDFYVDNNDKADFPENLDNLDVFDELEMEKFDSHLLGRKSCI